MTIKQLIQWGLKHDPYAPIIVIALPLFITTIGILMP